MFTAYKEKIKQIKSLNRLDKQQDKRKEGYA